MPTTITVPQAQAAAVIALTKTQQITDQLPTVGEVVNIDDDQPVALGTATITSIRPLKIWNAQGAQRMRIYGKEIMLIERDEFAVAEGYADFAALAAVSVPDEGDDLSLYIVTWTGFTP